MSDSDDFELLEEPIPEIHPKLKRLRSVVPYRKHPESKTSVKEPEVIDLEAEEEERLRILAPTGPLPSLSDATIHMIFANMALYELIATVPTLTPTWRGVRERELHARNTIVLLINNPTFQIYTGDYNTLTHLELPNLTRAGVQGLTASFPHVTNLTVKQAFPKGPSFFNLITLLERWSLTLQSLTISIEWVDNCILNEESKCRQFNRLFRAINALPHLTSLAIKSPKNISFYPNSPIPDDYKFNSLDLPILSRLEKFHFCCHDWANILIDSLVRYGAPNEGLRIIECDCTFTRLSDEEQELLRNSGMMERFNIMSLETSVDSITILTDFPMPRLYQLAIYCYSDSVPFLDVLHSMALLPNNLYAVITLSFDTMQDSVHFMESYHNMTEQDAPRLGNIQTLHFFLRGITSHRLLNSPHLAQMFPEMEKLIITYDMTACSACGFADVRQIDKNKFHVCRRKMAQTWRKCPKLTYMEINPNCHRGYVPK